MSSFGNPPDDPGTGRFFGHSPESDPTNSEPGAQRSVEFAYESGTGNPFADSQLGTDSRPANSGPPPTTPFGIFVHFLCLTIIGLLITVFLVASQQKTGQESRPPSPAADLSELILQGKIAFGAKELQKELKGGQQDDLDLPGFGEIGSARERMAGTVLIAEFEDEGKALRLLEQLEADARQIHYHFSRTELRTLDLLKRLFRGKQKITLTADDQAHLRKELLWFGELAVARETAGKNGRTNQELQKLVQNAKDRAVAMVLLVFAAVFALLIGIVGSLIMAARYASGNLRIRTPAYSQQTTIYLEVFTAWMVAFFLGSLIVGASMPDINPVVANLVVFAISLTGSLFWSVIRGKFSGEFLRDIGWQGNPFRELIPAVWGYVCSLPLLVLGYLVTLVLVTNFAPLQQMDLSESQPPHPILEWVVAGNSGSLVLVFLMASVVAPIVEETVFRGMLYRSLRDNTYWLQHLPSVLISALLSGLLFAAIHPQGLYFIPVLCSLGMAFAFIREWRGTVWSPMIMHAIHNGILMGTLVYMLV